METGNLTWAIVATALVLFMTPGVAFFYGGLVKAKSVISMMMMSFGSMGLVGVLWILVGYNMSTVSDPSLFAGDPFSDFALAAADDGILLYATYGATFAIITVALISGAIADRAKFGAWMVFAGLFAVLVYFPVSAWVWGGGWIMALGDTFGLPAVIDYAGGTAVHINAGAAALALALILGKRVAFGKGTHQPHNVPLTLIGVAILWFGWFGFNAGAQAFGDMSRPLRFSVGWPLKSSKTAKRPRSVPAPARLPAWWPLHRRARTSLPVGHSFSVFWWELCAPTRLS